MTDTDYIVVGGTGLIGTALVAFLRERGRTVLSVSSKTYADSVGARASVLINCNGNAVRFLARKDPQWDFEASVVSVHRSLHDFQSDLYVYISTVDVYNVLDDPSANHEGVAIRHRELDTYAFHKWTAERLVERFARRSAILRVGTVIGPGLKKNPVYDLLNSHPLHMSLESELTLIDTGTIARSIEAIIGAYPEREIFNVTASGSVKLRAFQEELGVAWSYAPGAEQTLYRYHVNNDKLAGLLPLPTGWEALAAFRESSAAQQGSPVKHT